MKTLQTLFAILFAGTLLTVSSFAQSSPAAVSSPSGASLPSDSPKVSTSATQPVAAGQPSAADMQKMMAQMVELAKLNENHKVLGETAGNWDYTVKMWMNDPSAKPQISKGSAVRKAIMGGRYVVGDYTGQMDMPGPDGKPKAMEFKGHGLEGYDNVKKKFVASWIDNMGTGIMFMDGDYDPATKALTYTGVEEAMPGMKAKVRQVVKMVDKNHMNLEWYEDHGGQEVKTMEISYTRKK